jgi:glucose/arabinose dehydrogenase
MPYLAAALLILVSLAFPAGALAQIDGSGPGVTYIVPPDNPFVGVAGARPEVYALGLRNPYRFSFDRATGDVLIGDVGQSTREEVDWISAAAVRGANFGWACREGKVDGPRVSDPAYPCPVTGAIEPLFDYANAGGSVVTGGFVVRDPALKGLVGRYLYADFTAGDIHSLALNFSDPDDQPTGLSVPNLSSFGQDADGRLYATNLFGNQVVRLTYGGSPGTLDSTQITGTFDSPVAIGTYPGDASRLFVAEQGGAVRLVVNGAVRPTPVVDVGAFGLSSGGERGLLSVVAAPDYATTGKLYVYYTDSGGDIRIDELTRLAANPEVADPATRRNVLTISHSSESNHNGGQMHFGADGCLWVSTGDGGGGDDQHNNAQSTGTLLGKLLRINPNAPGTGGSACGGPAQGGPPPVKDTTPPVLRARAPRRQRVLRNHGAIVRVRCNEDCKVAAGGTLLIGHRKLLLRRTRVALVGGHRARLVVRPRAHARKLLRRALDRHRHPRIQLRLRATDSAGNKSRLVRRGVRVRR